MSALWIHPNEPAQPASQEPSGFDVLQRTPADAAAAFQAGLALRGRLPARGPMPDAVLVAESDRSALSQLLALCLAPSLSIPVVKSGSVALPAFVRSQTMVIVYSEGDCEPEAVAVIKRVIDLGGMPFVIAPGGPSAEFARANGLPLVCLDDWPAAVHGNTTEIAFFAAVGAIAACLRESGRDLEDVVKDVLGLIERQCYAYGPDVLAEANPTRALARALQGQSLVFVSGTPLAGAAVRYAQMRLKNIADVDSWCVVLPDELPWLDSLNGCAILIHEADPPDYLQDRIGSVRRRLGVPMHELSMDGTSAMAQFWSTMTLLDWAAFYMAP